MTNNVLLLENKSLAALPPPQALALDLDLTLHDVIKHYDYSINQTLQYFGAQELNQAQLDQLGGSNFTGTRDIFAQYLGNDIADAALEYYFEHFLSKKIPFQAILPGAKELLYLVKKRFKLPIIGITNSEEKIAKKILKDLNVLQLLNYVVGAKDNLKLKPDPQMLLIGLTNINIKPSPHVWFIGDMPSDTKCAKIANCTAIRFYYEILPEDPNADFFINSHYHLFNIITSKLK